MIAVEEIQMKLKDALQEKGARCIHFGLGRTHTERSVSIQKSRGQSSHQDFQKQMNDIRRSA